MRIPRFLRRLLQVSLAWKIAGANAILTVALAAGFYLLPGTLAGPAVSSGVLITGMLAAATVNLVLITLALRPIRELGRAAERLWSGADARVQPTLLADRELNRVAHTINDLLEQLAADRSRLQRLTEKLLAARSSERAAFAYELTESIAQSVAALSLELAALQKAGNGANGVQRLEKLGRATTCLLDEIRRLARDVYPRHLDQLGLEPALRALVREAATADSRAVTFASHGPAAGPGALPRDVADTLYDVARETLRNASQHSRAGHINVSLDLEPHLARLSVADDGCGFVVGALDPNRGLGLSLIRERVALINGTLAINSVPGKGTRIDAVVPLVHAALPSNLLTTQANGVGAWSAT